MEKRYTGTKKQIEGAQNKPKSLKLKKWICAVIAGTIIAGPVSINSFQKQVHAMPAQQETSNIQDIEEYEEEYEMLPEIVEISDVSKINIEELKVLKQKPYQQEIAITRPLTTDIKFCSYDIDTFEEIVKKVNEYTSEIDKNAPQLEKFMKIYQMVGANIEYDRIAATKKADINDENLYNSRKLTNGLLRGKAVAAGYTDILSQLLKSVNIDAKEVSLKDKTGHVHYINIVYIDGKAYYADITKDSYQIKANKELKYCLKSEDDIKKEYSILTKNLPKANENMDKHKIMKYRQEYKDIKKVTTFRSQKQNVFFDTLKANINKIQTAKNDKKTEPSKDNDYII